MIWVEFAEPAGHEPGGRRPALVVSPIGYNRNSSYVVVCPLTTSPRPWPFKIPVPEDEPVTGFIVIDQIRAIDPNARFTVDIGQISDAVMSLVDQRLGELLELPPA